MTEFPALRDALVDAGRRRRRRRRRVFAVAPTLVGAAAIAVFVALPTSAPEHERTADPSPTARPSSDAVDQAFGVFRRPQVPADVVPAGALRSDVDRARSRLVGRSGRVRVYAVPAVRGGKPELCLVQAGLPATTASCAPLSGRAIGEDFASGLGTGDLFALLLPDGTRDVVLTRLDGTTTRPLLRDNGVVVRDAAKIGMASWTGASGTRYTKRNEFAPQATAPPRTCPSKLDPLPADAVDRAANVAMIAAGGLYPYADEAKVAGTARPAGTPCSQAITARSIEVTLHLTPRSATARTSASLSQGRLLLGMLGGQMTVYYFLH
jgi:hypothetical protein